MPDLKETILKRIMHPTLMNRSDILRCCLVITANVPIATMEEKATVYWCNCQIGLTGSAQFSFSVLLILSNAYRRFQPCLTTSPQTSA